MKKILVTCDSARDRLAFETYLKTDGREQEIAFLERTDCHWSQSNITIKKEKRLTLMLDGTQKHRRYCSKTRRTGISRSFPICS